MNSPSPAGDSGSNLRSKAVVFLVFTCMLSDYLLLTIIAPILPNYLKDDATKTAIGVLFASKPALQIITNPIWGIIVDRIGPALPLFAGVLILIASTLVYAFAENYELLLVARAVQGAASAATASGGMSLLASTHSGEERGSVMGVAMSGVALGVLAGFPLGGVLYQYGGKALPFLVVACVLAFDVLLQLGLLFSGVMPWTGHPKPFAPAASPCLELDTEDEEDEPLPGGPCHGVTAVLSDPYVLLCCLCLVAANSVIAMEEPLMPLYLSHAFHTTPAVQGLVMLASTGCYLLFTPLAGMAADKVAKWKLVLLGLLIMAAGLPLMALTHSFTLVPVALATSGLGIALVDAPIMALLADITEWRGLSAYGFVFAIQDSATSLGFLIGPILAPMIAEYLSYELTFACFAVAVLLVVPFVPLLRAVGTGRRIMAPGRRRRRFSSSSAPTSRMGSPRGAVRSPRVRTTPLMNPARHRDDDMDQSLLAAAEQA